MSRLEDIFRKKYGEQHFESSPQDWEILEGKLNEHDKDVLPAQINFNKGMRVWGSVIALGCAVIGIIWWFGLSTNNSDEELLSKKERANNPVVFEKNIDDDATSLNASDPTQADVTKNKDLTNSNKEANSVNTTEASIPSASNLNGDVSENSAYQPIASTAAKDNAGSNKREQALVESIKSNSHRYVAGTDNEARPAIAAQSKSAQEHRSENIVIEETRINENLNSQNKEVVNNAKLSASSSIGTDNITQSTITLHGLPAQEDRSEDIGSEETKTAANKNQTSVFGGLDNKLVVKNKHDAGAEALLATQNAVDNVMGDINSETSFAITEPNKENTLQANTENRLGMERLLLTGLLMETPRELTSPLNAFDTNALTSQFEFLIRVGVYGGPMSVDYLNSSDSLGGKGGLSYNAGVSINLKSNAWSLETGLNYYQQKKISQQVLWTYTDQGYWNTNTINYSIITSQNYWAPRDTSIYYWNETTSQDDTIIITTMDYVTSALDTVNVQKIDTVGYVNSTTANKRVQNSPAIRYIEIPVLIGYEIPIKRLTLFLQTGIGVGILSGYSKPTANTETTNVREMNEVVWSYLLKTGFLYHFTDHLSLSTAPHFRMNLSNATKEKDSVEKYRNLGVNVGIVYSF